MLMFIFGMFVGMIILVAISMVASIISDAISKKYRVKSWIDGCKALRERNEFLMNELQELRTRIKEEA